MKTWICVICGLIYDEARGWPDAGLDPAALRLERRAGRESADLEAVARAAAQGELDRRRRVAAKRAQIDRPRVDWRKDGRRDGEGRDGPEGARDSDHDRQYMRCDAVRRR